jgi:hypothetical protein
MLGKAVELTLCGVEFLLSEMVRAPGGAAAAG